MSLFGMSLKSQGFVGGDVPMGCPLGMSLGIPGTPGMSKGLPLGLTNPTFPNLRRLDLEPNAGCPNFDVTVLSNQRGYEALVGTVGISRTQSILQNPDRASFSMASRSPSRRGPSARHVKRLRIKFCQLPRSQLDRKCVGLHG